MNETDAPFINDAESEILKPYKVSITETLQTEVEVMAYDLADAEEQVSDAYNNEAYVLTADDYVGADFHAVLDEQVLEILREESIAMNKNTTPIAENMYVKELFSVLSDNNRDTSGLSALIGHVTDMEDFVKRAEDTISVMKSQLSELKEVQDHPVKAALQNAVKTLETKVAEVKANLTELKNGIAEGCKNAVAAFKEKGISALDKLASFFHVKDNLEGWKKNNQLVIQADNKAIAQINAFATEYHSAGRAIKNMARVAIGKAPIDAKKEAGKLAKALSAPYRAQTAALKGLQKSLDKAMDKLDGLEAKAAANRENHNIEKRPSILGALAANKARVAREKQEMPVPEKTKAKGAER